MDWKTRKLAGKRGWWVQVAQAAVAIAVLAAAVVGFHGLRTAHGHVEELLTDSMESIRLVEQLRMRALELHIAGRRVVFAKSSQERAALREAIPPLKREIADLSARYRGLTLYPGEDTVWRIFTSQYHEMCDGLARFDGLAERSPELARTGWSDVMPEQISALNHSASRLIGINAAVGRRLLFELHEVQGRAFFWLVVIVVVGMGGLVVVALAGLAWRHDRLVRAQIEQHSADLDAFSGRVAHDLRAAMTPVFGYAQLLSRPGQTDHARAAFADRLIDGSRRLTDLIDGLLAFARGSLAEGGQAEVRVAIEHALASVAHREVAVAVDVPSGLGVNLSAPLLESVVLNLVSNACKYLDENRRPDVRVNAFRRGPNVIVEVKDNGIGIDATHLQAIFEPFFRAKSVSTASGQGLGLAIVKRIVEAHGGHVRATSALGVGSTFTLTLPACTVPSEA